MQLTVRWDFMEEMKLLRSLSTKHSCVYITTLPMAVEDKKKKTIPQLELSIQTHYHERYRSDYNHQLKHQTVSQLRN